jgi:hypothetical protein
MDESKNEELVSQFLARDSRFRRGKGPEEIAKGERERGHQRSRNQMASIAFTEKVLFKRPFGWLATNPLSNDGRSFELGLGWWVVRIEDIKKLTSSKVPEWEIEIQVGYEARLVFPSELRELVIRNTNERTYDKWKEEVLNTEDDLKRLLTNACGRMKQPMTASWITSPSSERLLDRMGIKKEREWAFLFQGQEFK